MCEFKSGIILKDRVILSPEGNESHSDLLESMGIEDRTTNNVNAKFVRVELIPPEGDCSKDINKWEYRVDQDFLPRWYERILKNTKKSFRMLSKIILKRERLEFVINFGLM